MSIARQIQGVNVPPAGEYEIDPLHSMVGFAVRHLMVSKVRGRFNGFTGTLHVADGPAESKVAVDIDLASIDTGSDQRDEHLRSSDFFDVANDPSMMFTAAGIEWSGGEIGRLVGDLTLHGVTRPLTLDFEYLGTVTDPMAGGTKIGFSAAGTLDREDFGLTYNAALDGGGVLIGKSITLEIEVEALQKA